MAKLMGERIAPALAAAPVGTHGQVTGHVSGKSWRGLVRISYVAVQTERKRFSRDDSAITVAVTGKTFEFEFHGTQKGMRAANAITFRICRVRESERSDSLTLHGPVIVNPTDAIAEKRRFSAALCRTTPGAGDLLAQRT